MMRPLILFLALVPGLLSARTDLPASTQAWTGERCLSVTAEPGGDTLHFREEAPGQAPRISVCALRTFGQIQLWKGQAWVFGDRTPWVASWFAQTGRRNPHIYGRSRIFASRDFRTWIPVGDGSPCPDAHGDFASQVIPLDDGTFLVSGWLFRDGEAFSPLGIYRLGPGGAWTFVRLAQPSAPGFPTPRDTGFAQWERFKEGWDGLARGFDTCVRTPRGLVVVNRARSFCLLTDNAALQPFRCATLGNGEAGSFLGMQPLKDGRILLAVLGGPSGMGADGMAGAQGTWAANALALALLKARSTPATPASRPVAWSILDPADGNLTPCAPPPGAPPGLTPREARSFDFRVDAQGRVHPAR